MEYSAKAIAGGETKPSASYLDACSTADIVIHFRPFHPLSSIFTQIRPLSQPGVSATASWWKSV